ncbi:MAG: hypothetical protein L0312_19015, partial [Acidobacteria bacterium]|nr:hypothetical protein [Acidobacteriota bacterium]
MTLEEKQKWAKEQLPFDLFIQQILAHAISEFAEDTRATLDATPIEQKDAVASVLAAGVTKLLTALRTTVVGAPP